MVNIFKRNAKTGASEERGMTECLDALVRSYTTLISAVDFLEVSPISPSDAYDGSMYAYTA